MVLDGGGALRQRAATTTAAVCDGNVEYPLRRVLGSAGQQRPSQVLHREVGQDQQSSTVSGRVSSVSLAVSPCYVASEVGHRALFLCHLAQNMQTFPPFSNFLHHC